MQAVNTIQDDALHSSSSSRNCLQYIYVQGM